MINLKKHGHANAKKGYSVASALFIPKELRVSDGVKNSGEMDINEVATLFTLPENCVVKDAYIVTLKATTESTATFQLKLGTDALMNAVASGRAANDIAGSLTAKKFTGATPKDITLTIGTAKIKSGEFLICVEFSEPTKGNGEYLAV